MQNQTKTKILFVLESYFPNIGGVENLFKLLAESLVSRGFEVEVLTAKSQIPLNQKILNGVKITQIPFRSRFIFSFVGWIWGLSLHADIIHTTSYNAALSAFVISMLRNKKIIVTFHELWGELWYKLPFLNNLQKSIYNRYEKFIANLNFDKFIAVSDYTKESLIEAGIKAEKILRIYNGIDYDKFHAELAGIDNKLQKSEFTFLFTSRAGVSKGLDILVEAVKELSHIVHRTSHSYRVVVHSSDDRQFGILKKIEDKAREYNLERVSFDRSRYTDEEWIELVSNANCVIIPSYSEGFSFVAAETCALGVPVIHSGKGALKEVVSGKFLEFENMNPRDLAEKMKLAMQDKFDEIPLKKFELKDSVLEYIKLYSELL